MKQNIETCYAAIIFVLNILLYFIIINKYTVG